MAAETNLSRQSAAEALGTFCLVFAGTCAIVVNDLHAGIITHLGIALAFGLVVMTVIHTVGDVSGAHINPAVTLGFFVARRFPGRWVLPYVLAQCLGALAASMLIRWIFPEHRNLGATIPTVGVSATVVLELLLTALLMFVILSVSTGGKEKGITAGLTIGSVVALEALFAGPLTGASMNPARSLGPALVSGQTSMLWIYVLAPILGAFCAVPLCRLIRSKDCCSQTGCAPSRA